LSKNTQVKCRLHFYLAKYFFNTRSFDDAELHLDRAEKRAKTEEEAINVALAKAEFIEFRGTKSEAVDYLKQRLVDTKK